MPAIAVSSTSERRETRLLDLQLVVPATPDAPRCAPKRTAHGIRALLHWAMAVSEDDSGGMLRSHGRPVTAVPSSAFTGFRFPPEIIVLAVRWYLRFGLSLRDVEDLLAEREIEVDHVTVFRWVQRFTPLLADAARPCRHAVGDRWYVDEIYVQVAGVGG